MAVLCMLRKEIARTDVSMKVHQSAVIEPQTPQILRHIPKILTQKEVFKVHSGTLMVMHEALGYANLFVNTKSKERMSTLDVMSQPQSTLIRCHSVFGTARKFDIY